VSPPNALRAPLTSPGTQALVPITAQQSPVCATYPSPGALHLNCVYTCVCAPACTHLHVPHTRTRVHTCVCHCSASPRRSRMVWGASALAALAALHPADAIWHANTADSPTVRVGMSSSSSAKEMKGADWHKPSGLMSLGDGSEAWAASILQISNACT